MTVNFPNNPTIGLTWLDPSNSVSYTWDGTKWSSTGTGISFTTVIFTIDNDDNALVGGTVTAAINAALITRGKIFTTADLRPGNTILIVDSGNANFNVNVLIGQYLYDGVVWVAVPSIGANVLAIFGRVGSVNAEDGDYILDQLGDVDTTTVPPTPTTNSVLRFNGTNWVPGDARNSPEVELPLTKAGNPVTPTLGFNITGLTILP